MSENCGDEKCDIDEPSVTMVDVLEQEKKLEEESAAVLGGSDEKCCTYKQGYIKRQALYSCLTCCPESRNDLSKCAGICLACSYQCHENHELVELYTKRNFRCDCPTERILGKKCSFVNDLQEEKYKKNDLNLYNHNFQGLYCSCKRPYPDPEDPIEDTMIQCAICEDWFHSRHLESSFSSSSKKLDYCEVACSGCMQKYSFLKDYTGIVSKNMEMDYEESDISVTETDDKLKSDLDKSISDIMNMSSASTSHDDQTDQPPNKKMKNDASGIDNKECCRPVENVNYVSGSVFWPDNWRETLCRCEKCNKMYNDLNISFLVDIEDPTQLYEQQGIKKSQETVYERGIRALSTIGHAQQIDAIVEYNRMKEKLKEYLQQFVDTKKIVTEDDINRFFQEMKNEKNKTVGQPYFCR